MSGILQLTVRLIRAGQRIQTRKWSFWGIFGIIFLGTTVVLAQLDLLPDGSKTTVAEANPVTVDVVATATSTPAIPVAAESHSQLSLPITYVVEENVPVQITIAKINLSAPVFNPTSTDNDQLNKVLLKGAVRYPTTAKLGEVGNVVIIGHSSYLPVVINQAYKSFNGIQKLKKGDVITVYSTTTAYTYVVRTVTTENATVDAIPLEVSGRVLTLTTCNSFGEKTSRFVVVADFVDSHSISS